MHSLSTERSEVIDSSGILIKKISEDTILIVIIYVIILVTWLLGTATGTILGTIDLTI